jgi:apolipoprotein N-acyltransferase
VRDAPGTLGLLGRGVASGLLLGGAFPPFNLWILALVGLVPLLAGLEDLATANRARGLSAWAGSAFAAGWAAGLTYFVLLLWWIVLLDAPSLTIPWVRYPGTFAIAGWLGLFPGLFALAYAWIRARTGAPAWLAAPALWTAADGLRGWGELGFPWGHLGYSQISFPAALQMASVAGVFGLTAWAVAMNSLSLEALRTRGRPRLVAAAVLVFAVPVMLGAVRLARAPELPTQRIALVQPNVPNVDKWKPALRSRHFENLAELSRQGVAAGAELVLWPETAAPCYLRRDRRWRPWVEELASDLGVPIFTGYPDYQVVKDGGDPRTTFTNSAALVTPADGFVASMDKIELVPFGERVPFSQYFSVLARVDFGEADFVPGAAPVIFDLGEWKFGNLVCFEAIFPRLTRRYANEGADILVNITNDSWFGAGSGARQHADMAIMRCVETGCGMARCANSGISLAADPWGRTFGETSLFEREVSVVDVPRRSSRTVYLRLGNWVLAGSVMVSIALLVAAFFRRSGGGAPSFTPRESAG